jgi:hypothetical protein
MRMTSIEWICIEKNMPAIKKDNQSDYILVKMDDGKITTAWYQFVATECLSTGFINAIYNADNYPLEGVVAWAIL